jgi:P27 family predicted phage terminase small subunit
MRGRKPKPSALRALGGNAGKRKLNTNEPKFGGIPECPDWLTAAAKTEWNRIVTELHSLDMLRSVDTAALSGYCQAYARWKSAEQTVETEGQTIDEPIISKTGELVGHKVKRHPATLIARDERAAMARLAALFGFDPSSRSRMSAPATKPKTLNDILDDEGPDPAYVQ